MSTNVSHKRPLPIIRLFVSSTFSDQQHERNALHAKVWPKLERYCQQRGFTFQAIDLRWGVPAEAGLHHRTMGVCFEELKRSQKTSPEPNFLILLGNRYGWRPLPEMISTEEYGDLLKHAHGEAERAILETWYRLDTNAIPAVHLLRSRKDSPDGKDYTQIRDAEGNLVKKEDGSPLDTDHWLSVQRTLWEIVNRAFPATGLAGRFQSSTDTETEPVPSVVRFQTSATEQEIWQGAVQVANAKEHVIACFRTIQEGDVVPPPQQQKKFVDLHPDGTNDADAQSALAQLKNQLEGRLAPAKIIRTECQWATDKYGKLTGDVTTSHIKQLCRCVYKRLRRIILQQIEAYWGGCDLSATNATVAQIRGTKIELDLECADHQRFAEERAPASTFIGRDAEIALIHKYLTRPTNHPLIVHGPSGSGKTALLGKVIQEVTPRNPDGSRATTGPLVLSRFIGTTPESSNLRSLLTNLCRELRQEFPITKTEQTPDGRSESNTAPLPTDLNQLIEEFYSQLSKATAARPIYLFLDALDQIEDSDVARTVFWIRRDLVPSKTECYARLVATCLSPSIDATEDELTEDSKPCEPYRELKLREMLNGEPLGTLNEEQAHELFKTWLKTANRKLSPESPEQNHLIQSALRSETCRSPLYLKVLSEEARCWRSFDEAPVLPESLPNTLSKLLAAVLDRLDQQSEHGPLVRIALSLLVSARYGLSEGELLEILLRDREFSVILALGNRQYGHELPPLTTRIPVAPWARLRSDLAPYLAERSAPGTSVVHFYHRQVEQAVRTNYLKPPKQQTSRHRQLAMHFLSRWNRRDSILPDIRTVSELPWHLIGIANYAAERSKPRALKLLASVFVCPMFLEAAGKHGLIRQLANDLGNGVQLLPNEEPRRKTIVLIAKILAAHFGYIVNHPALTLQVVVNELRHVPNGGQTQASFVEACVDRLNKSLKTWVLAITPSFMDILDERTLRFELPRFQAGFGLAFSANSKYLAAAGGTSVRIWDCHTGRLYSVLWGITFPGAPSFVAYSVTFSSDDTQLWIGGEDGDVLLWRIRAGEFRIPSRPYAQALQEAFEFYSSHMSRDPNPTRRVSAASGIPRADLLDFRRRMGEGDMREVFGPAPQIPTEASVNRFDILPGDSPPGVFTNPGAAIVSLSIDSNRGCLIAKFRNGITAEWDCERYMLSRQFLTSQFDDAGSVSDEVSALATTHNLRVVGTSRGILRILDSRDGRLVAERTAHTTDIRQVIVAPNEALIASSSLDGTITVFTFPPAEPSSRLAALTEVNAVSLATSADRFVVRRGSSLELRRLTDGSLLREWPQPLEAIFWGNSVAIAPDGRYILAPDGWGHIALHPTDSSEQFRSIELPIQEAVSCLCVDCNLTSIAVGFDDGTAFVFSLDHRDWRRIHTETHGVRKRTPELSSLRGAFSIHGMAFSSDGKHVLVESANGLLHEHDAKTGELLKSRSVPLNYHEAHGSQGFVDEDPCDGVPDSPAGRLAHEENKINCHWWVRAVLGESVFYPAGGRSPVGYFPITGDQYLCQPEGSIWVLCKGNSAQLVGLVGAPSQISAERGDECATQNFASLMKAVSPLLDKYSGKIGGPQVSPDLERSEAGQLGSYRTVETQGPAELSNRPIAPAEFGGHHSKSSVSSAEIDSYVDWTLSLVRTHEPAAESNEYTQQCGSFLVTTSSAMDHPGATSHRTANPKRVVELQQLFREVLRHWSLISSHVPFWNRSKSTPPNPSCDTLEINPVVLQSHVAEYERRCQQWLALSWWQKKTAPPPRFPSISDIEFECIRASNA